MCSTAGKPANGWHARTVTAACYRRLMSAFPTGVAAMTTTDELNRPRGATCTSLSSVSLCPPTLLVCLHNGSGTLTAIGTRGSFVVNLLHCRGHDAGTVFSVPADNRFASVVWRPVGRLRLPWLVRDAFAVALCRLADSAVVGDHTVVFGEVTEVAQTDDVPLLYGMRRFSARPNVALSE